MCSGRWYEAPRWAITRAPGSGGTGALRGECAGNGDGMRLRNWWWCVALEVVEAAAAVTRTASTGASGRNKNDASSSSTNHDVSQQTRSILLHLLCAPRHVVAQTPEIAGLSSINSRSTLHHPNNNTLGSEEEQGVPFAHALPPPSENARSEREARGEKRGERVTTEGHDLSFRSRKN